MSDEYPTEEQITKWMAASSLRQQIATKQCREAFKAKIPTGGPVPCVSCGKMIEPAEHHGYENDAVVMQCQAGYGSRHDTSLIWLVICDDCIEAKCVTEKWLEHLDRQSTPAPANGDEK